MALIMLVEDNDDHAILAQVALSGSDKVFQVDRAISAEECLAMLTEKKYDAILLDYSLPKKNGLETLQHIERLSYDAPVVMITSQGDEQIAVEAMKHGAHDYVSKSDDYLAKLPLILQKAIESHEMAKERAELQKRIAESENRLRNIFENIEAGLLQITDDCSISYANPKAKDYLSIDGNPQGVDICPLFASGEGKRENCCEDCVIRYCLESGESNNCEIKYQEKYFSATIAETQLGESSTRQLVAVLIDVTEQRRLQEQLIQSERIGALGRMASGIAHDFNNLLAAILGRTELMLMDAEDMGKTKAHLRIIHKAALDGAETVRRIQEFTGVAKQKEFTMLDVSEIVQDALKMTEPRWKDQPQRDGLTVDVSMDLKSQQAALGSAAGLREVLTNMIFNALDAMPTGGKLCIRTYDENDKVCICISDTGVGVPPDITSSLFEPFFTSKGADHTGLGLSVAYGIISRHDGRIDVRSEQGKGSDFIVKLPACKNNVNQQEAVAESPRVKGVNILAIDDEEAIRDLLSNILLRFDNNVTTAADGIEGIKAFQSGEFDIVFTDLGMPEMTGWEVARHIKSIAPEMPVVLITGWGVELDESELKERKVDFVISKPFQISHIMEAISKVMRDRTIAA